MNDVIIDPTDPTLPPLAVVAVPEGVREFATPDGSYFSDANGFIALVHEAVHLMTDAMHDEDPEGDAEVFINVADSFGHMLVQQLLDTMESVNLSIAFGLPEAEGHDAPSIDPLD